MNLNHDNLAIDPVCGMQIAPISAAAVLEWQGENVHFCSPRCASKFRAEPEKYPLVPRGIDEGPIARLRTFPRPTELCPPFEGSFPEGPMARPLQSLQWLAKEPNADRSPQRRARCAGN